VEYVFFVDLRFESSSQMDAALAGLGRHCGDVKELGRYVAAKWLMGKSKSGDVRRGGVEGEGRMSR